MYVTDRTARSVAIRRMNIYGLSSWRRTRSRFSSGRWFDLWPRHFDLREDRKKVAVCTFNIFAVQPMVIGEGEGGGDQPRKRVVGASGLDPSLLFSARHRLSRIMGKTGKRGRCRYRREGGGGSVCVGFYTQRRLSIEVFRWLVCTRLWWRLAGGEKVFVIQTMQLRGRRLTERPR